MTEITTFAESCRRMLDDTGKLSKAIPGFIARTAQSDLSMAIAQAITEQSILVAEAGTGTGKTFAYLIPCLLSGKRALISTATKTLQDQLFQKDLPTLIQSLGISSRIQNLKGRANYICHYRVHLHAEEGSFQTPLCAHEILHIRDKLSQMTHGERSELPELAEDSSVWPYVTSTVDNCLGSECSHYDACFLVKARKRAMESDIVVINHHLFFADSRLKQEGLGDLLPGVDAVIFDEAHQLSDIAIHFNGERVGTRQFQDLLHDIMREWPVLDLANQPLKILNHQFEQLVSLLLQALPAREDRISWNTLKHNKSFTDGVTDWLSLKDALLTCFQSQDSIKIPGVTRCKERLDALSQILLYFTHEKSSRILWVERFKHTLVFHATPYDVAASFQEILDRHRCAYVFTSATLTIANSFDCFCNELGLRSAKTLLLSSPFNFQEQALLYLPRGLPDPKNTRYYDSLLEKVIPVIEAFKGRCFFLFTSHNALKRVAEMLVHAINYPLLVQGTESKPILLARFRQLGNAVLLGTATFWEGVDVKGAALSCVIIDKLPFASPSDPVVHGRMTHLKEQGLSAFDALSLPNAVIALKQGIGRLIRDVSDTGVLMIGDPRLTGRSYGKAIMESLPPMPKTRDEQKVLKFIKELVTDDDIPGN